MSTQRDIRYLVPHEAARLRRTLEALALAAEEKGNVMAVRRWALVDVALQSGLRASEIAALHVADVRVGYGEAVLVVRHGKGNKYREVVISDALKAHLKAFLAWRQDRGEDVSVAAPVFVGEHGPLTRKGVWYGVKRALSAVGIEREGYGAHAMRHTYATFLYKASGNNLALVQDALGHADPRTTRVYAQPLREDREAAANALARAYHQEERIRRPWAKGGASPRVVDALPMDALALGPGVRVALPA